MLRIICAIGGRKQFNGYVLALLLSGYGVYSGAPFGEFAAAVSVALLGTSAAVAVEDRAKHNAAESEGP